MDLRRNISVFLYLACYLCTGKCMSNWLVVSIVIVLIIIIVYSYYYYYYYYYYVVVVVVVVVVVCFCGRYKLE